MSGEAEEAAKNRQQRRRTVRSQSGNDNRLAVLMLRLHDDGSVPRREGESDRSYLARIRVKATRVQHEDRKRKRAAARSARKRNRHD